MQPNRLKLIAIIAGLIIFLIGGFLFLKIKRTPDDVSLEFWGTYDDSDTYAPLIAQFQQQYPWIEVEYKKFPYDQYERALLEAWASQKGPDIFMIHNTWLHKYKNQIVPAPQSEKGLNPKIYMDTFMPAAASDFIKDGQIYAMPLYLDTLALYYNEDILRDIYLDYPPTETWITEPPKTWDDFIRLVETITKKDEWGNIKNAGAALGTSINVNRASDILTLLMLQTGAEMTSEDAKTATFDRTLSVDGREYNPGLRSLEFYTDFANPRKKVYTWNLKQDYSLDAFIEGEAALMIGYSYHIRTIRQRNSRLNFKVAPVPQIKERQVDVNYGTYWALTVPRLAKHPKEAWQFITAASSREISPYYLYAAGRPTSRIDLVLTQEQADPFLGVFARQGLRSKAWYQIDSNAIEKILNETIDKVNTGKAQPASALHEAAQEVTLLMNPPAPPPGPIKPPKDFGF